MARVLFVCVQNAGRSQIAQALFASVGDGRHEARSAGSAPAKHVHPEVVEVMRERGVDLSQRVPRRLEHADADWADVVVTMGCADACPFIPGKSYVGWDLPDPRGQSLEHVRDLREQIDERVHDLDRELG